MSKIKTSEKSLAEEKMAASSTFQVISIEIILAIPKVDKKATSKPSNKLGKNAVLTENTYKNRLVEEIKRKEEYG